jgi:YggT family protein
MQALHFIIDALLTLVVVAFLLRVLMPIVRADFRNPIGEAVLRFTNPLVLPLRRLLKPVGRVDVASIAALVIVQLLGTVLLLGIVSPSLVTAGNVLAIGLKELLHTVLQFFTVAILIYAVLSWVAPGAHSPANQLLTRICEPLLAPVRRIVPPIGGLDLSALFVLIGLQALMILLR